MKYGKSELMDEGWEAMGLMLDKEMPTSRPGSNVYFWMSIAVLLAFLGGVYTANLFQTDPEKETIYVTIMEDAEQVVVVKEVPQQVSAFTRNTTTPTVAQTQQIATSNFKTTSQLTSLQDTDAAYFEHASANTKAIGLSIVDEKPTWATLFGDGNESLNQVAGLRRSPISKSIILTERPVAQYAHIDHDLKAPRKGQWGIGLNSGINPSRNTKVASIKADYTRPLGRFNVVGAEFIYGAEDEIGFFNKRNAVEEPTSTFAPNPVESDGGKPVEEQSLSPRQFRYAAGLVVGQKIGHRFYTNFSAGINLIQNSYIDDVELKTLTPYNLIQYHWSGYTSVSLGLKVSKLINFELNGSKSMLVRESGSLQPGHSDHISAGLRFTF